MVNLVRGFVIDVRQLRKRHRGLRKYISRFPISQSLAMTTLINFLGIYLEQAGQNLYATFNNRLQSGHREGSKYLPTV